MSTPFFHTIGILSSMVISQKSETRELAFTDASSCLLFQVMLSSSSKSCSRWNQNVGTWVQLIPLPGLHKLKSISPWDAKQSTEISISVESTWNQIMEQRSIAPKALDKGVVSVIETALVGLRIRHKPETFKRKQFMQDSRTSEFMRSA